MKSRLTAFTMVLAFLVGLVFLVVLFSIPVPVYAGAEGSGWIADRKVNEIDVVGDDQWPSMATDSNGYIYVAFEKRHSSVSYIVVARSTDGGDTWEFFDAMWTDANVHRFQYPSIAIDPYDDRVYVAYELEIERDPIPDTHDVYVWRDVGPRRSRCG